MTIEPGIYNITIFQGADMQLYFAWRDENNELVSLLGYTARLMMRESVGSATPFLTLTTANGGITIDEDENIIYINASAATTTAIVENSGFYDLELITPDGVVYRLLKGSVTIDAEVTR